MASGPGKYDAVCGAAFAETHSSTNTGHHTVILMVIGGNQGMGFSVQSTDPNVAKLLPDFLRKTADQVAEGS